MKALYFYSGNPMTHLVIADNGDNLEVTIVSDAPGGATSVAYSEMDDEDIEELWAFLCDRKGVPR